MSDPHIARLTAIQTSVSEPDPVLLRDTELYPQSWNAFDSLAETEASIGAKADAVRDYRRAYALNPKDTAALEAWRALSGK